MQFLVFCLLATDRSTLTRSSHMSWSFCSCPAEIPLGFAWTLSLSFVRCPVASESRLPLLFIWIWWLIQLASCIPAQPQLPPLFWMLSFPMDRTKLHAFSPAISLHQAFNSFQQPGLCVCWTIHFNVVIGHHPCRWSYHAGGGGVRRKGHAAAAVRSDNTVHVIEFGGRDESDTILASTTVMQMSECTHHVHVHVLTCSFV